MDNIFKRYTKQDIKDILENYRPRPYYIIKYPPKPDKTHEVIENWFEYEDMKEVTRTTGKTTTEIVNILNKCGAY